MATVSIVPTLSQLFPFPCNVNITREEGHCLWFGQCLRDDTYVTGSQLNCYDNTMARNITDLGDEFIQLLNDTCPQYWDRGKVCCDYNQLYALSSQLDYPRQLFSRCPACLKNFIDHFCFTTCHPDQSLYMTPTTCKNGNNSEGEATKAVANVTIYLSEDYAGKLYNSCKTVQDPQASNNVVDIMCGGSDECTSHRWLGFLGDPTQNHNSPFPMAYEFIPKGATGNLPPGAEAKEKDFIPCNTTDTQYRCSCADCGTPDICPAPPVATKNKFPRSTVMYSILGTGLFLSIVLFIALMFFGVWVFATRENQGSGASTFSRGGGYGTLDNNDSPTSSVGSINAEDIPTVNALSPNPPHITACMPCYISGAHLENWIKIVFYRWGCFVATFWPVVMIVGILLVVFISGLTLVLHVTHVLPFAITTDPVQLWSSPDSQARQEKNYFDTHFNPFYRTEMVIFTAVDKNDYTVFQPANVYGVSNWTFGPVLSSKVLLEVSCLSCVRMCSLHACACVCMYACMFVACMCMYAHVCQL